MIGECMLNFEKFSTGVLTYLWKNYFEKKKPIKQTSYVGVYFLRIIKIQYVENNIICLRYKKKKKYAQKNINSIVIIY